MDSSQAPLISNDAREEQLEYEAEDHLDSASNISKAGDGKPSVFVLLLTFAAGISGLLFGCTWLGLGIWFGNANARQMIPVLSLQHSSRSVRLYRTASSLP